MATEIRHWTLEELHALPEDGNKYELVHGDLWVTPTPSDRHGDIVARLTALLLPYVLAQGLGLVYHPRAVFRIGRDVEVEPDLMVRHPHPDRDGSWETAPRPILVVEVLSPSTRHRDVGRKRALYVDDARLDEYWVIDGDARTITVHAPGREARMVSERLTWAPAGAAEPLTFSLERVLAWGIRSSAIA